MIRVLNIPFFFVFFDFCMHFVYDSYVYTRTADEFKYCRNGLQRVMSDITWTAVLSDIGVYDTAVEQVLYEPNKTNTTAVVQRKQSGKSAINSTRDNHTVANCSVNPNLIHPFLFFSIIIVVFPSSVVHNMQALQE